MAGVDATRIFNFNITVTDGGFFRAGAEVEWSMRTYPSPICKFYYITEGECEIIIEGTAYRAKAGDWFFIPAGVEHSYHNFGGTPFKKYWMHFDLYPRRDIVRLLGIGHLISDFNQRRVGELFERFSRLYGSEDFADGLSVKAIALELLSIFLKASKRENSEIKLDSSGPGFSGVFSYIENNMSMKISNKALADIAHMHPTHFIRYFKKETGQTPGEYVIGRKMERAKYLLESTELQIGEISEHLGFYDAMHFSKTFKKRYSISPTAYRKNATGDSYR